MAGRLVGTRVDVSHLAPHREQLIRTAVHQLQSYAFRTWAYGDSVGFEGLLDAADVLRDDGPREFARGWARAWATRAEPFRESDNTAPGHAICRIIEATGDEELCETAVRLATWLTSRPVVREVFAAFEHTPLQEPYGMRVLTDSDRALLADGGRGVFVDCMHFDPPFFARLSTIVREPAWLELALVQMQAFIALLQDDATGLFYHFYLERTGQAYVAGWSRGQGWALLGLLDVLAFAPASVAREILVGSLRRLIAALVRSQREDGHWSALATEPASGDEFSSAAFFALGMRRALRSGLVSGADVERASEMATTATWRSVDAQGVLRNVSAAVGASTMTSHYYHVPVGLMVPWGQGPLLMLAADVARHG